MKANGIISVKIGKQSHRILSGQTIPKVIENFWKKSQQFEDLKKSGIISEDGNEEKKADKSVDIKADKK